MTKNSTTEAIAAIATPIGEAAIAVIRVSGNQAIKIVSGMFRGKKNLIAAKGQTIHHGKFFAEDGGVIDDVLVSVFRKPHSYTGEDSVEISCHGSQYVANKILATLLHVGIRQAEPGEFTKRAFLNGKMDLSQAEGVASLIASKSEASLRASMNQLEGRFSSEINILRAELIDINSLLEVELDFSEEGLEVISRSDMIRKIGALKLRIDEMIKSYSVGKLYREGVSVVIVGEPNVGKSSLFNALLRESRAIVTDIPGTTRDSIEESVSIGGVHFRLTDTAGIRETHDRVEVEGIARSKNLISRADIVLLVRDTLGEQVGGIDETLKEDGKNILVAHNKIDLVGNSEVKNAQSKDEAEFANIWISAKSGEGIDDLRQKLFSMAFSQSSDEDGVCVTSDRHWSLLTQARSSIESAESGLKNSISNEFISVDVRAALDFLGEIVGEVSSDDVLNNIFKKFCIGK